MTTTDEPGHGSSANRLGLHTWPETDRSEAPLLVIPLGATEQHGPHLPLETDSIIATAWARGVADGIDGALVAPTLPYGSSGEHQAFAGTLSIGRKVLHQVVVELARSASPRFGRLAFLSGHAGNEGALGPALRQLRHEGHDATHLVPTWSSARFGPIDAHAGRVETSLLLHLAPELVRQDRAEPGNTDALSELMDRLVTAGVVAVSPNGILGDPTGASAALGEALLTDLVSRTIGQLAPAGPLGPLSEP